MKNLLIAAAAVGLAVTTTAAFVSEAQALGPRGFPAHRYSAPRAGAGAYKHPSCVLPVPDPYLQSFRDRYDCWGWPYPYFATHKPYWIEPVPYVWAGVKWGPYWQGRAP